MSILKKTSIFALLMALFLFWILYLRSELEGKFYYVSEWAGYLLVVPLAASITHLLNKQLSNRVLFFILLGAIVPLVLSTEFEIILFFQKIVMLAAGAFITTRLIKSG